MKLSTELLREQANVNSRAQRLYQDGYHLEVNNALESGLIYLITSPAGHTYAVDPLIKRCDCPYFQKRNAHLKDDPFAEPIFCKHYLGAEQLRQEMEVEKMQEAQAAQWEAEQANAEDAEWGCSRL